jgi:3-oxoacyl-[acyl-carrier-protein] synthase-1
VNPLLFSSFTAASCIGLGCEATLDALINQRSGLAPCQFETVDLDTWIGEIAGLDEVTVRADLREYDCRNHRLAQLGLAQDGFVEAVAEVSKRFGQNRVGVFLGTSTSGILQTELAYRRRDPATGALPADFMYRHTHNPFALADFVRRYLFLEGPAAVASSACSSSAKAFGAARRMIEAGLVDAAVIGGVDSLCLTTLYGFNSLGLLSDQPCRPFDADRDGISIGEAAAFGILARPHGNLNPDGILLLGVGESSDAYHMSSPHPEGLGARLAMESALADAGLHPEDIDYINLHGTATASNDAAEGKAVSALFGTATPCSSTKGFTGHTLGAAGGIEAVICALASREGLLPGSVHTLVQDPGIAIDYLLANRRQPVLRVLSNSFGFGGTNCSLVFGHAN